MKVYIGNYPKHRWYHNYLYKWFDYTNDQRKYIKIDHWDSWSADYTLAEIILPVLVQLKETQHGAPLVDPRDVPEFLQPSHIVEGDSVDNTHFDRWDYVLSEMIWAFEQKCRDNWEEDYYEYEEDKTHQLGLKLVWEDKEGRERHQERMSNGFRLFGRYYENLWD